MDNPPKKYWSICIYLVLALVTTVVFYQVRTYDFINFDDPNYIYENPNIQNGITPEAVKWAFTTGYVGNWHPLTWLSHMLDCQLFGPRAGEHHLTNLIFHIANTLLLFIVLKQMTQKLWQSAFVAALFALHPLHVESVAWVSERKDVLSIFFWMLTMWAYVRFVRRPKIASYLSVVVFLALGLMSKPMLVTLPFVLLLLDYWPLDRLSPKQGKAGLKYSLSSLLIEKVPLFAMVAASSVVTFIIQKKGGALLEGQNYSFIIRLANAFISYVQYIVKMIYPIDMTVIYPHAGQNISIPYAVISAIFLLAVTILVFRFAKKQRYLVVGWLWYLGTLVPVIGLIQVGRQAFADRYTYISLTGLFIIIAWGIPELLAKWRYKKIALTLSGLFVILALSICTHFQLRYWQNSLTLFQHALDVTGDSHLSHFCIAEPLREQGKLDEAIYHYKKAIELNPYAADVYLDLGTALTAKGKFAEAIFLYNKALQIAPDLIELRINLGVALTESGKLAEAVKEYEKILRIQPGNVFINNNLGAVFLQQGKFDEAIEYFSRALQIDPDSTLARDNLNRALAEKQKIKSTENTKE